MLAAAENGGFPNGNGRSRVTLDAVNVRLLRALLDDPRLPIAELARRVDLSGPAVAERIQRLEAAGVIAGYRLDLSRLGSQARGL
jgi:Lrp/AsnC family leucine-responsive transcriptional regulator